MGMLWYKNISKGIAEEPYFAKVICPDSSVKNMIASLVTGTKF